MKWGYSSVGRAPALQAGGQEFESLYLHCFLRKALADYSVGAFLFLYSGKKLLIMGSHKTQRHLPPETDLYAGNPFPSSDAKPCVVQSRKWTFTQKSYSFPRSGAKPFPVEIQIKMDLDFIG